MSKRKSIPHISLDSNILGEREWILPWDKVSFIKKMYCCEICLNDPIIEGEISFYIFVLEFLNLNVGWLLPRPLQFLKYSTNVALWYVDIVFLCKNRTVLGNSCCLLILCNGQNNFRYCILLFMREQRMSWEMKWRMLEEDQKNRNGNINQSTDKR